MSPMLGVSFGAVCVTLLLATIALFAVWGLDRQRRYLLLIAPTPALTALALIAQAVPGLWIGWRVGISTIVEIAAALLAWEGMARRNGHTLGRQVAIASAAVGVAGLFAATVLIRSPMWVLHIQGAVVAGIGFIGVFKSHLLGGKRVGDTVVGCAFLVFAGVIAIRSWVGLDSVALDRGLGPDLGGWSNWIYVAYALLTFLIGAVIVAQEVRQVVEQLQSERDIDPLTGLLNRRGFEAAVATRMRDERSSYALVISDLDHFKRVNDALGHAAGDEVLTTYGALVSEKGHLGVYGRVGGEEFAIFLSGATAKDAATVAESLRRALGATTFDFPAQRFRVTTSVGVAVAEPGVTYEDLFQAADQCLYRAKYAGRNMTWPEIPQVRFVGT